MKMCKVEGCNNNNRAYGYCAKHNYRIKKYGNPNFVKKHMNIKLDFIINDNGCFICTSHYRDSKGYPRKMWDGLSRPISRFVYTEMFGEIADGLVVRHKCDNSGCINPEHLELGTTADNNNDMKERGRSPRGSEHHNAKLNESDVLEIKSMLSKGFTQKNIAKKFSIAESLVSMIKHRKKWAHVGDET